MNSDKVKKSKNSLEQYYITRKRYHMNVDWRINLTFKNAQNRSIKQGKPFDLDKDYLKKIWEEQEGRCALTGMEFDLRDLDTGRPNPDGPSLDKINPAEGYVRGNVRFITYQANWCRSDYGDEALIAFAKRLIEYNEGIIV
jgi:hypothetical protein